MLKRGTASHSDTGEGAVALRADGMVTAYAGEPHCVECGRTWSPQGGWITYP